MKKKTPQKENLKKKLHNNNMNMGHDKVTPLRTKSTPIEEETHRKGKLNNPSSSFVDKREEQDSQNLSNQTTEEEPTTDPYDLAVTQIATLEKDMLYLRAEFENYKKQAIKERSNLIRYGGKELVLALLDILDNFDRALGMEVSVDTIHSFKEGVFLTASGLKATLDRFGIRAIDCVNQAFDPSLHEAIGSEESEDVTPGQITQVLKKPYKFHDKVIRTGQVVISKKPEQAI